MSEFLLAGQVGDPAQVLPAGAGAKLYILSLGTFGTQVASTGGVDSPARMETDDYAPAGPGGRIILRRVLQLVEWTGAVSVVRVRPILDFNTVLAGEQFTLPQPVGASQRAILRVFVARACTYVRLRLEVLSRTGRVEFLGAHAQMRILEQTAPIAAGGG